MDVLEYLKSRQNELERVNHPFAERSLPFRYLYSYGVGVLALGNMKAITELQDRYDYFLECIALPKEQREKLITDINDHFEFRLTECIKLLRTKEVQYCFLADLYKLRGFADWSAEYCSRVIENYQQIFHMTPAEMDFLQNFYDASVKGELEIAQNYCHQFRSAGFDISYRLLQYIYIGYTDKDEYGEIHIKAGKTLCFDKPTYVNGNIYVERGGSLLIDGAEITMHGSVFVDGGRIQICNAKWFVESCDEECFMTIQAAAVVRIENSVIDCNLQCGFLRQKAGRLLIEESEFYRSARERMLHFDGRYIRIIRSSFYGAQQGFITLAGASQVHIADCDFAHASADYGSAVYSDSIDNVLIENCSFRQCTAKYLGAAVYFKYEKLGQIVKKETLLQCEPEESAVFNASRKRN